MHWFCQLVLIHWIFVLKIDSFLTLSWSRFYKWLWNLLLLNPSGCFQNDRFAYFDMRSILNFDFLIFLLVYNDYILIRVFSIFKFSFPSFFLILFVFLFIWDLSEWLWLLVLLDWYLGWLIVIQSLFLWFILRALCLPYKTRLLSLFWLSCIFLFLIICFNFHWPIIINNHRL